MQHVAKTLSIFLLPVTAVILIPLQMHTLGWTLVCAGLATLLFCEKQVRKDMFLLYFSLSLLGITPITTDLSYMHIFQMGTLLTLAIAVPYTISRYVYKDYNIHFKFHNGRSWNKKEIFYIFLTGFIAYFLLPFALVNTGSYLNWTVPPGALSLFVLFLGTNALGIWDELFFVSTVLGILRRYLSFPIANLTQSVLFTSFLYELGFRGWLFPIIFIFALLQGYIFKKTDSLLYIIAIHLTLDFVLYLALIYTHHPTWMPIFLIK